MRHHTHSSRKSTLAVLVFLLVLAHRVSGQEAQPRPVITPPFGMGAGRPVPSAEPIDPAEALRSLTIVKPGEEPVSHHELSPETACAGWGSVIADAEYLYFRAHRPALDFGITSTSAGLGPVGAINSLDWQARSGLRVGVGYRAPDDGVQATVLYTYLHAGQTGWLNQPAGGTLFATLTHPGTIERVGTARGASSLNYNVFDLELDGRWHPTSALTVRPFGGVRFARIDQNVQAAYDGVDANQAFVQSHTCFDGGGPRFGGEVRYAALGEVGLFGRGSASLLVGDVSSSVVETNNGGATLLTDVTQSARTVIPVVDMAVGLEWRHHNFHVSAAYELSNWFGLITTPDFVDDAHQGKFIRRTGDLSLDGIAVRFQYDY